MDFEPWKPLSRAFAEANLRKSFRERGFIFRGAILL